jgi:hypothetical protein
MARKGHKNTLEHNANISAARKKVVQENGGWLHSPETRAKMSAAHLAADCHKFDPIRRPDLVGECCQICGTPQAELVGCLCRDHCHGCGEHRGLVCNDCNLALGRFKDSPENLQRALEYLQAHRCGQ